MQTYSRLSSLLYAIIVALRWPGKSGVVAEEFGITEHPKCHSQLRWGCLFRPLRASACSRGAFATAGSAAALISFCDGHFWGVAASECNTAEGALSFAGPSPSPPTSGWDAMATPRKFWCDVTAPYFVPLDHGIQPLLSRHNCAASGKAGMTAAKCGIVEREACVDACLGCR